MQEIVNAIIILTLLTVIYKYFEAHSYDIVMVKSNVNGKSYLVRNIENKQDAADLLAKIAVKLEKLVNIIVESGYDTIYNKYMIFTKLNIICFLEIFLYNYIKIF